MYFRRLAWGGLVVVLAAGFLVVLSWQGVARQRAEEWGAQRARNAGLPIPVRTHQVVQETVTDVVGATCVTQPHSSAPLSVSMASNALATYRLDRVLVRGGDVVQAGDPLFELDDSILRLVVEKAEAEFEARRTQLETLVQLQREKAASQSDVGLARLRLSDARLTLEIARRDLSNCVVRSPVSGVVGPVAVAEGTRLKNHTPLGEVYRLDPVTVVMDFPVERMNHLRVGLEAEVVLDSDTNQRLVGQVVGFAPIAETETRVVKTYVRVDNPDLLLRGGVTGYCRLRPDEREAAVVPRVAVVRRKGRAVVMSVSDGRARLRNVEVGAMVREGYLEVLSGLDVGEEIVVFGLEGLEEGDAVNTDWRQWAHRETESHARRDPLPHSRTLPSS